MYDDGEENTEQMNTSKKLSKKGYYLLLGTLVGMVCAGCVAYWKIETYYDDKAQNIIDDVYEETEGL